MTKTRSAVVARAGLAAWLVFAAFGVHAQSDVSVSPDFLLVEEGETATITVSLSEQLTEDANIGYRIEGVSGFVPGTNATHPEASTKDYTDVTGGSVTIGAGDTEATITIRILEDDEIDPAQAGLGVFLNDPPAGAGYRLDPSDATTARLIINEGICDRNQRLAEYFLTLIPDTNDCAAVGLSQLFGITRLDVPVLDQALRMGDFWDVRSNDLDLSSRLSQDVLPQGVFEGIGANKLDLSSNTFTMISPEVFAARDLRNQTEIRETLLELYMSNVPLVELPAGIFRGLGKLRGLHLPTGADGNPLLPLDVGFELVREVSATAVELKLTVAQGAPFDITADLSVHQATVVAGGNPVSRLSISRGETESDVFTLTQTSAELGVVTAALSPPPATTDCRRPSAEEDHACYVGVGFSRERLSFWLGPEATLSVDAPERVFVEEGETTEIAVTLNEPALADLDISYGFRIGDSFELDFQIEGVVYPGVGADDYTDETAGIVTFAAGTTEAAIRIRIRQDDEIDPTREIMAILLPPPPAGAGYHLAPVEGTTVRLAIKEGICDRNAQIVEAIFKAVPGKRDCADVSRRDIHNSVGSLEISPIEQPLRAGDFWDMDSLNDLDLSARLSHELPRGVFAGLSGLIKLDLSSNTFTTLSRDAFRGIGFLQFGISNTLEELYLSNLPLTGLPEGFFNTFISRDPFTGIPRTDLRGVHLPTDAAGDALLPLDVGFELVREISATAVELKLRVVQGVPYDMTADLSVHQSTVTVGGVPVSQLSILRGRVESEVFTLTRTLGQPGAVTAALSPPPATTDCRRPSATEDHACYVGVGFSSASPGFRLGQAPVTLSIDSPGPRFVEEDETTAITLLLSEALEEAVEIGYQIRSGDGDALNFLIDGVVYPGADGDDYEDVTAGVVTIEAGMTEAEIRVRIEQDDEIEPSRELLAVVLTPPSPAAPYRLVSDEEAMTILVIEEGVCDRNPGIVAAISEAVGGNPDCADLSASEIGAITGLEIPRLEEPLRAGDFWDLEGLEDLDLSSKLSHDLPRGVFGGLGGLVNLDLSGNTLTALSPEVFVASGFRQSAVRNGLEELYLDDLPLTGLAAGFFGTFLNESPVEGDPQIALRGVHLPTDAEGNALLFLDVGLVQVREVSASAVEVKLTVAQGAPYDITAALSTRLVTASVGQVMIPRGRVESGTFVLTQTSGQQGIVTATLSSPPATSDCRRPSAGANHACYVGVGFPRERLSFRLGPAPTLSIAPSGPLFVEEGETTAITISLSDPAAEAVEIGYRIRTGTGAVDELNFLLDEIIYPGASTHDYTNETGDETGGTVTIETGSTSVEIRIRVEQDDEIDATRELLAVVFPPPAAGVGYELASDGGSTVIVIIKEGVCDRNAGIIEAISEAVGGNPDCADLSAPEIGAITGFEVPRLTAPLRAGDFWDLAGLRDLDLRAKLSHALPRGVFGGLGNLVRLDLSSNTFTTLSPGVFAASGFEQPAVSGTLEELYLNDLPLSGLAAGFFGAFLDEDSSPAISLRGVHLPTDSEGNALLPLDVGFVKVGDVSVSAVEVRLVVAQGAPFAISAELSTQRATVSTGGAPVSRVSISRGRTESGAFVLTRTSDDPGVVTAALSTPPATVDCRRPSADADHACYVGVGFSPRQPSLQLVRAPILSIEPPGALFVGEGETTAITLSFGEPVEEAVEIAYQIRSGDGAELDFLIDGVVYPGADGDDYTNETGSAAPGVVTIEAGTTEAAIRIRIRDDDDVEPTRELLAVFLPPPAAGAGYRLASAEGSTTIVVIEEGVCDRNAGVVEGILTAVGTSNCADVGDPEIAALTGFTLPNLDAPLRADDFLGLRGVTALDLSGKLSHDLADGVFGELGGLIKLDLSGNTFTTLSPGVFANSAATLQELYLNDLPLSGLAAGLFGGMTALRGLHLPTDGGGDPLLPLDVELVQVREVSTGVVEVRLRVAQGAPFDISADLTVQEATLSANQLSISRGEVESEVLTLTRTSDQQAVVTASLSAPPATSDCRRPSATADHACYVGVGFSPASPEFRLGEDAAGLRLRIRTFLEGALE